MEKKEKTVPFSMLLLLTYSGRRQTASWENDNWPQDTEAPPLSFVSTKDSADILSIKKKKVP